MKTTSDSAVLRSQWGIGSRVKLAALVLLLAGVSFFSTGCYDEPGYYGRRPIRAGYYASYEGPGPYYGYDPYYDHGYGPGIGVGVYRNRPGYARRPYYGRGEYRRGYYRRSGDRRDWERRTSRDRRRDWDRRGPGERKRGSRRSAPPNAEREAPPDARLE